MATHTLDVSLLIGFLLALAISKLVRGCCHNTGYDCVPTGSSNGNGAKTMVTVKRNGGKHYNAIFDGIRFDCLPFRNVKH